MTPRRPRHKAPTTRKNRTGRNNNARAHTDMPRQDQHIVLPPQMDEATEPESFFLLVRFDRPVVFAYMFAV